MSNVDGTALISSESTTADVVASGLMAVATLTFLASWATLFQWLDETGRYFGVAPFDLLGGSLFVLAGGLTLVGLGSYFGYVEGTPSDTAGFVVGAVVALLWAIVGGLVAAQWGGNAPVVWLGGAVVFGVLAAVASLSPPEDLGSTLPVALLLALLGYVVVAGHVNVGWTWTPGWTETVFPGSELVPVLIIHGALLGIWSAAKAKRGFGAQGRQFGAYCLIGVTVFSMIGVLGLLITFILVKGLDVVLTQASLGGGTLALFGVTLPWLEVPFVTSVPGGLFVEVPGVMPAVVGTLWLVLGAVTFAVPLGVGAAVFLTEYADQGRFTQLVEVATNGLWSTPSIVFGLFGLAFLVPRISGGNSIFVGQLVLGFMLLPLVLITSREAIKAVPDEYRDASAALGVTKWETIRSVVVPAAMPGVITGIILGVGRIAGETAPLLLVFGGSPFPSSGPQVLGSFEFSARPPFVLNDALLSPASALPYQLYSSITAGVFDHPAFSSTEYGWGTALVLLLVVIGLYAVGVGSRIYFRRKLHHE
ncbi:phosphate ABC transporter permease PstA [Haloplanus litoreus]|uniref:Phosphate transport system permease protein PstA n=1 Tax=Haloplanus litoreus TaxID=767515 RepID=A0ABD5ZTJ8_9EURY